MKNIFVPFRTFMKLVRRVCSGSVTIKTCSVCIDDHLHRLGRQLGPGLGHLALPRMHNRLHPCSQHPLRSQWIQDLSCRKGAAIKKEKQILD